MKNVAFFQNIENLLNGGSLNEIVNGNPGIGGAEYELLVVSYYLGIRKNIDTWLLTSSRNNYPHTQYAYVENLEGACTFCVKHKIKNLVINYFMFNETILNKFSKKLNIIIWAHNSINFRIYQRMYSAPYVKRVVCVSREMLDIYRDQLASLKSTYIYNYFPLKPKDFYTSKIKNINNHNVVYMGSITRLKGFHLLAKSWKRVLQKVPDAKLYVIGSYKLYSRDCKLGKFGIAEDSYEQEFMPYLLDRNGRILPSVHFLGLMGNEKYDILGKCKVGVPNPSGIDETFCITAIEMQLMGCGITTIKESAYLDTIYNKKYLYHRCASLSDYIVERLISTRDNYDEVYNFISTKFNDNIILKKWEYLILNIDFRFVHPQHSDIKYQVKPLKDFLLKLKTIFPILSHLPPVLWIYKFYYYYILKIFKI